MKCYECKWLDRSVILTSIPPQYGCTLGFGSHYADHECEYDFMPIVRCKDCRHAEHRKQMPGQVYCKRDKLSTFCAVHDDDDFCKYGERRE